ncbi:TauD/TfdA family dioxygenase [Streptomyces sp. 3211.6]|uniref:TauD/TfdA family dioxygenase n=1 Tax=Streptomyces sp. 3211.6 TaxID=1938845 RepID=UPI000C2C0007|nr:TauD/TfdA family dioxygenase [Streptomyces sp. 3211.6]
MSVDVSEMVGNDAVVTLGEPERAELEALARDLLRSAPSRIDTTEWVERARDLSTLLPARLRRTLRRFTRDAGPDAMLLLRNLPGHPDGLPDTPLAAGSVQRTATVPAAALALVSLGLGELVSFREEKQGALVHDVVPVPGMEEYQGNAGSVALNMHTENAFHPFRPDFVGLMCLRNDHADIAGLRVASVRRALPLLDDADRALLHQPRYVTAAPASFGEGQGLPEAVGVLSGSPDDPDITVDFTSTTPLDDEAAAALARLRTAIDRVTTTLILAPGDLAFVDNRLALHGRNSFQPRYDGRDRWLQRAFVHRDLRRSRALRPADGPVVHGTP